MTDAAQTPVLSSAMLELLGSVSQDVEKMMENLKPGDVIPGKGFYIGQWQPEGLSQAFNVYAAGEDLTYEKGKRGAMTHYNVRQFGHIEDWRSHGCHTYADDDALFKDMEDGSYKGEWVIPPFEVLELIHKTLQKIPKLRDSFYTADEKNSPDHPAHYWSNTTGTSPAGVNFCALSLCFNTGNSEWFQKHIKLSFRPVRFEPVPQGGP